MFETYKYDSSLYQKVVDNYNAGKKYNIVKWKWNYVSHPDPISGKPSGTSSKETEKSLDCSTLKDFNRELWDLFTEFCQEKGYNIIWGAFGLENRNPEKPFKQYCDGLVYGLINEEYHECIKNQDVSHFMSCLVHFGYFNLDFNVIE